MLVQKLLVFYSKIYPSVQELLVLDSETDTRPPKEPVHVHFEWLEVQEGFLSDMKYGMKNNKFYLLD